MLIKTYFKPMILLISLFSLVACSSSEKVKEEEYQFAGGIKLLDIPPDLTSSDKNLVMQIPKPSLHACELLMAADAKYKVEQANKPKAVIDNERPEKEDDLYAE